MPHGQHLQWDSQALWHELVPLLPGLSVEVLASVDSTNTYLLERARHSSGRRHEDSQPCLLVAEHQTGGRGRMGRGWSAAPGASLTFSLSLPIARADWSGLSLAVGAALADALEPPVAGTAPRLGLKWPNDLWLMDGPARGRKLGGVLIETVGIGQSEVAVANMVDLLATTQKMDPVDAYMLVSTCGDLRISEIVDMPNVVVSFYFPRAVFE